MAKQKPDDAVGLNIGRNANNAAAWLSQQKEKRAEPVQPAPIAVIPATETVVSTSKANPELRTEENNQSTEVEDKKEPSPAKSATKGTGRKLPQTTLTKLSPEDEEAYWEPFFNSRGFERPTKNLLITERVHGVISMLARVAATEHKHRMTLNEVLEVIVLSHVEENKAVLAKIQERWKNRQEWL